MIQQPTLLAYSPNVSTTVQRQDLQAREQTRRQIVRVAARTAPQIVSSVPKCQLTKASRLNPSDTVNGICASSRPLLSAEPPKPAILVHNSDQLEALRSSRANGEPVLLIVEDQQANGVSWPVIGRRLPAKSAPDSPSHSSRRQVEPVTGRRSRRVNGGRTSQQPKQFSDGAQSNGFHFLHPFSQSNLNDCNQMIEESNERRESLKLQGGEKKRAKDAQKMIPYQQKNQTFCTVPNCSTIVADSRYCCCRDAIDLICLEVPRIHLHPPPIESYPQMSSQSFPQFCCTKDQPNCPPRSQMSSKPQSHQARAKTSHRHSHHEHNSCSNLLDESSVNRSSSCHDVRSSNRHSRGRPDHASPPPIPQPKPTTHLIPLMEMRRRDLDPNMRSSDQPSEMKGRFEATESLPTSVSCMYDSLAAELKAKLANPRLGPILLPPRDYDTLRRTQGKLADIENRRSTNPQLVGKQSGKRQATVENSEKPTSVKDSTDQKEVEGNSRSNLSRSRSNSSSGLGSLSAGAQSLVSPTSSNSSSSEEFEGRRIRSKQDENMSQHGSDSGHSGSGHIDSHSESDASFNNHWAYPKQRDNQPRPNTNSDSRGKGIHGHNPSKVAPGVLWNGRVEVPLKVNSDQNGSQVYLATKQIIY